MTLLLFRDDAYLKSCDAKVLGINERGGIILDQTVFYPTAGGQPGDKGSLMVDGSPIAIAQDAGRDAERRGQAAVARDVFGPPAGLPVFDPGWRTSVALSLGLSLCLSPKEHPSPPHSTGTTATATCAAIPSCIFSAPRSPSR